MSNETCKVCQLPKANGPEGIGVPSTPIDKICWRHLSFPGTHGEVDCYRLGYTRELAAREAAEARWTQAVEIGCATQQAREAAEKERDEWFRSVKSSLERRDTAESALAAERVANAGLREALEKLASDCGQYSSQNAALAESLRANGWYAFALRASDLANAWSHFATKARAALSAAQPLPIGALRAASVEVGCGFRGCPDFDPRLEPPSAPAAAPAPIVRGEEKK